MRRILTLPFALRRAALGVAILVIVVGVFGSSAAAGPIDDWSGLRRPLHLARLAPGASCPVSSVDTRVAWKRHNIFGGAGIGRGPVYPGLGFTRSLVRATRDQQYRGRWFGEKVFWYVLPSYRGPALIRGRQLDGTGRLGFNGRKFPDPELRILPGESVSWTGQLPGSRGLPSAVRILRAGCYGFQIDGTNFSRMVVVRAELAAD